MPREGEVVRLASWAGLGVALIGGLVVFGACSTMTSVQEVRRAALWEAATQCASGMASLKVDRIDNDGRVLLTLFQGGKQDLPAFNDCYARKVPEKLAIAERAASPARIVESPSSAGLTSATIRIVNNRILVPVVLNENQTATFLLDTGANITVITPDLARRAGLEVPAGAPKARARFASGQEVEVPLIRVKSLRVASAKIDNLGVAVYELAPLDSSAKPPLAVDGFLGADFTGRFTMTVDPRAGTLTLQLTDTPAR